MSFLLVPKELPVPVFNRSNGGKDIDVTWNVITPNRASQEGYVFRYDIRYFQYDDQINDIVVQVGNVTKYKIEGVDEDAEYSVQVRVVVLKSTEPKLTFQYGTWGGGLIRKPVSKLNNYSVTTLCVFKLPHIISLASAKVYEIRVHV